MAGGKASDFLSTPRKSKHRGPLCIPRWVHRPGLSHCRPASPALACCPEVCTSELAPSPLLADRNALTQPRVLPTSFSLVAITPRSYLPTYPIGRAYYYGQLFCPHMSAFTSMWEKAILQSVLSDDQVEPGILICSWFLEFMAGTLEGETGWGSRIPGSDFILRFEKYLLSMFCDDDSLYTKSCPGDH